MIIGIGVDLLDVRRFEKALLRHQERLLQRLFLSSEQDFVNKRISKYSGKNSSLFIQSLEYSKIYTAKEAFVKALGSGFRNGISWHHVEVVRLVSGQPSINPLSLARQRVSDLAGSAEVSIHLSLTDEIPFVQAFVVIDKVLP